MKITTIYWIIERCIISLSIIVPLLMVIAFFTLLERKVMASLQRRVGPNIHGYYGVFQPFLDGVKLLTKELLIPAKANFYIFLFSPMFMMTLSFSLWAIIPLSFNFSIFDSDFSLLFFFILSSLNVYNIILAGWSSNSKYAFLGSVRAIAQFLSYELVFGFALLFMLLFIGSLRLFAVIYKQYYIGFLFYPLLPFALIFFIVLLMETNRAPFDLPEAESELVAGYNVEYSSIMFAMFFLGEYCNIISMSSIWIILFWGGFVGQSYGTIFFVLKILFFCFLFIFIRSLLPRYRLDQLIYVGWHVMLPICIGVLFFLTCLLAFTQSAALTVISSFYRPLLTWRGFNRVIMGSPELHVKLQLSPLDKLAFQEVYNEYNFMFLKWQWRMNDMLHFFIDGDLQMLLDNGVTKLEYIKRMVNNTLTPHYKWTGDRLMRELERLPLDPLLGDGAQLPLMTFGHFCDERSPGFVGLNRTPLLDGNWQLHVLMETLRMKADGENMLLTAWSDYYPHYVKAGKSLAGWIYQAFDVDLNDSLPHSYSHIDILLKRMIGNEIPFDWETETSYVMGRVYLGLDKQISLLRALDLQLSNRLDFSEYSRACAWKLKYRHPINMINDIYWKSGAVFDLGVLNNPFAKKHSLIADQWVFLESKQDRLHPKEIIKQYQLDKIEMFPMAPQGIIQSQFYTL